MYRQFGHSYFLKKQKKAFYKKLAFINGLLLIVSMSCSSLFFIGLPFFGINADDNSDLCPVAADIVFAIDRSGSMAYTSKCDYWKLECVNRPSCTSYVWQLYTEYNQNENWCDAKNQSAPHNSVWTEYDPTKMAAAKSAANNFLNLMGGSDQSALVSFANTASLDKMLSSNHGQTQTAVSTLIPVGATNIGDAIGLSTGELRSTRANAQAVKVIILLTDGKANKPNGSGSGENPADVAYAQSKAIEAASYGFKVFTIGLGTDGEINETMLQNIANATGAQYYHAPTTEDLPGIYNLIATKTCEYGTIAGCKYSDSDKDGAIAGHVKLSGWEIKLDNSVHLTQLTDSNGCYKFTGLNAGTYTVSEGGQGSTPYTQTYPAAKTYSINLTDGQDVVDIDFGNYLPICGNQFIDSGEECEIAINGANICNTDCTFKPQCTDNDQDTYAIEGDDCGPVDCNDTNAAVYPGASEICDGQDNDCDGQVDEELGSVPTTCGVGECAATGAQICQGGQIVDTCQAGTPTNEICDNKDNNCNGIVDESIAAIPTNCGIGACASTGEKTCSYGELVDSCQAGQPSSETCDGQVDENCDGTVDEGCDCTTGTTKSCGQTDVGECAYGSQTCAGGIWGTCSGAINSTDEICDGKDNDCDGQTDEEISSVPTTCGVGECAATGAQVCRDGKTVDTCQAGSPTDEICDNKDNNCNGQIDENLTRPTSCGLGACASNTGLETCTAGNWGGNTCNPLQGAGTEICDGQVDENCDGNVDEGCGCTTGATKSCGQTDVGECALGSQTCADGVWGACSGAINPTDEICDSKDNDCDELVDEGGVCGGGTIVCGNSLKEGNEQCDSGTTNGQVCIAPYAGTCEYCSNICQLITVTGPTCGDKICNAQETCSSCSADCGSCGGGGGGGGGSIFESTASGYATTTLTPIVKGAEAAPILKITKAVTSKLDFASPGQKGIEYLITITNDGNLTAYGVNLKDVLPAGFRYVDNVSNNRSWDLGDIELGKSKAVTYKINVDQDAKPMIYTNTAEVTAANFATTVKASANLTVKSPSVLAASGFSLKELISLIVVLKVLLLAAFLIKKRIVPSQSGLISRMIGKMLY